MTPTAPGLAYTRVTWRCPVCFALHEREVYLPLPDLYVHLWDMHSVRVTGYNARRGHTLMDHTGSWGEAHRRRGGCVSRTYPSERVLTRFAAQLPHRPLGVCVA